MKRGNQIWLNGRLIPEKEANISLFTHALHYGTGVFEGIRVYRQKSGGGAVFRLREHMERFQESLKIMSLPCPFSLDTLCAAALDTVRANGFEECYIRPIAYVAEGPLGLYPGKEPPVHVAFLTWEWGAYLGDEGLQNGIRIRTSSFVRPHPNSVFTKGKITGQYVTSVLSKMEAVRDGYDEGLLLDTEGYVAEGSGENVFMVRDGVVKTAPLTAILPGITRKTALYLLKRFDYNCVEARFTRDELWTADEVFMVGTAAEVTPVREIDGRVIGKGEPGPITKRVQAEYLAMVHGERSEFTDRGRDWLIRI